MKTALLIALAMIGVSYAWGMRGDLIGGEKGAMLPGAILGTVLALMSGSPEIASHFYIPAAVGAASMYFGGTETYAQTMSFAYIRKNGKPLDFKKSMIGLCFKGSTWFGLCGAFLGISFAAMAGKLYRWYDFLIYFILVPGMRLLGRLIFNMPYKPEEGKMPKLYFSEGRPEQYGELIGMYVGVLILMIVRHDSLGIAMAIAGAVAGSLGWMLSHTINVYTTAPMKNGKYFFGKYQTNGFIDNWKIMEFGLGAAGALGISVAFSCFSGTILNYQNCIIFNGGDVFKGVAPSSSTTIIALTFVWIILLLADGCHWLVKEPKPYKEDLMQKRAHNIIRQDEFEEMMKDASDTPPKKSYYVYEKVTEIIERPLYSYIPLVLILAGGIKAAAIEALIAVYWVAVEKAAGDRLRKQNFDTKLVWVGGLIGLMLLFGAVFLASETWGVSMFLLTMFVYFVVYIFLSQFVNPKTRKAVRENGFKLKRVANCTKSCFTVFSHYIFCTVLFLILLCFR